MEWYGFTQHIGHCIWPSVIKRSTKIDVTEPVKVNSASPDTMWRQWGPSGSFITLDGDEQCVHFIASRLKWSVFWALANMEELSLTQRIRATVSHPSVARSSNVGMRLQVARLVTASFSHAPTLYALARRIFSTGDIVSLVDNLGHIPDCGQFQHTHPLLLLQVQLKIRAGN
jgi:hypothetical protein